MKIDLVFLVILVVILVCNNKTNNNEHMTVTDDMISTINALQVRCAALEAQCSTFAAKTQNIWSVGDQVTRIKGDLYIDNNGCCITSGWGMFSFGRKNRGFGVNPNINNGEYPFYYNEGVGVFNVL